MRIIWDKLAVIKLSQDHRIVYDYRHVPTLRRFAINDSRIRAVMGPFGSGKSSAMIMEIIRRAHQQKPSPVDGIKRSRWAIVRNTYPQLKDTTIKTVKQWLPEGIAGIWKEVEHNFYIDCFPGVYIELMFRALDNADHVRNLLSLEITGAWLNEFREIDKAIFEAIDGRIGRYPAEKDGGCGWHGIIMDTNPPDEMSYWFKYFEKIRPDNARLWKQPSGLSPFAENIRNLPKGYYKNLAKGKDDQFVNVYVHGRYGFTYEGKLVYENYNDNVHVAGNILYPMRNLPLILGFDFALDPSCVIAQVTPRGQLLILDELMGEGMGIKRFALDMLLPLLSTKYAGMQCVGWGDPSGRTRSPTDESTCYDILWSHEIGLRNIDAADTNALIPRISAVDTYLTKMVDGQPGILLSPNCQILRKGFNGGYRRKRVPGVSDMYYDEPEKNVFSHLHDALQYLCMYVLGGRKNDEKKEEILRRLRQSRRGGYAYKPADRVVGY